MIPLFGRGGGGHIAVGHSIQHKHFVTFFVEDVEDFKFESSRRWNLAHSVVSAGKQCAPLRNLTDRACSFKTHTCHNLSSMQAQINT